MVVYVFNILLLCSYYFFLLLLKLPHRKALFCGLAGMQLFVISALRYGIGTDYESYQLQYAYIVEMGFPEGIFYKYFEPGYNFLNLLASKTSLGFQFVVTASSFVTIFCVTYSIYKYSSSVLFSFFLYITLGFYYASFCLIRQEMAMAICLLAIADMKKQKTVKVSLIILFAALFHFGALILLPVYWIIHLKINVHKCLVVFILLFGFLFFWDTIIQIGVALFPKYKGYLTSEFMAGKNIKSLALYLAIFGIIFVHRKQLLMLNKTNVVYTNMAIYMLLIALFPLRMSQFDRFPPFLSIFSILCLPEIIRSYQCLRSRHMYILLLIVFGLLWNIYYFYSGISGVIPYQTIFNIPK